MTDEPRPLDVLANVRSSAAYPPRPLIDVVRESAAKIAAEQFESRWEHLVPAWVLRAELRHARPILHSLIDAYQPVEIDVATIPDPDGDAALRIVLAAAGEAPGEVLALLLHA